MIPKRVLLDNFLSFKGPVELVFEDGEPLWVLCGPNGVGKSAVFDAITYALFGEHRGGNRGAEALIRHGENEFRIEFEFEFAAQVYRITRTRDRKRTTQRLHTRNQEGDWEAIPGVNSSKELVAWVVQTLGLEFTAFSASLLLRQGEAERVLGDPGQRLTILKEIIGFGRYENLYERVNGEMKRHKERLDTLQTRRDALAPVTPEEWASAAARFSAAEAERDHAHERLTTLLSLAKDSERWERLRQKHVDMERQIAEACELEASADQIAVQANRLAELRNVLPVLHTVVHLRTEILDQEKRQVKLTRQVAERTAERDAKRNAADQERQKADQHRDRASTLDRRIRSAESAIDKLAGQIQQAERLSACRDNLTELRLKLAGFPRDLSERVVAASEAEKRATLAKDALPWLEALTRERSRFLNAAQVEVDAAALERAAADEVKKLETALVETENTSIAAAATLRATEDECKRLETRLKESQDRQTNYTRLEGQAACSLCGQPIDAAHAKTESDRLAKETRTRKQALTQGQKRAVEARTAAGQADAALDQVRGQLSASGQRQAESARQKETARAARQDAAQRYEDARARLADDMRTKVPACPDAGVASFPTTADVDALRVTAAGLDETRQTLAQLHEQDNAWRQTETEIRAQEAVLNQWDEAPALALLRQQRTAADAELRHISAEHETVQQAQTEAASAAKRLEAAGQFVAAEVDILIGDLAKLASELASHRGQLSAQTGRLPSPWQDRLAIIDVAEVGRLDRERLNLEEACVDSRFARLQEDRARRGEWERQLRELTGEIAAVAEPARRPAAQVGSEAESASQALAPLEQKRDHAKAARDELERRTDELDRLIHELQATERQYELHKKLDQLLGKKGLQRDLVRTAEREIVDRANETLQQLSDGELRLGLAEDEGEGNDAADKVLDLRVWRGDDPVPIGALFLSGSQKFRVAVAMALALGRFASIQARPLECVIIDEGFGCLDRQGRQAMIDELQRLRQFLRRIILVSHQEEFAEAFSVGFRLTSGPDGTTAERFRR